MTPFISRRRFLSLLHVLFFSALLFASGVRADVLTEHQLWSPLLIHGQTLVFIQPDGTLTVLDLDSGDVLKRLRLDQGLFASVFRVYGDHIFGIESNGVFLFDADTLEVQWHQRMDRPIHYGDLFIGGEGDATLIAVRAADGKTAWRRDVGRGVDCFLAGNRLFGLRSNARDPDGNFLLCLDAGTGEILWRESPPPGRFWAAMACSGDTVFVLAGDSPSTGADELLRWTFAGEKLPAGKPDPKYLEMDYSTRVMLENGITVDGVEHRRSRVFLPEWPRRNLTSAERSRLNLSEKVVVECLPLPGDGVLVFRKYYDSHSVLDSDAPDRRIDFLDKGRAAWRIIPGYLNLHRGATVEAATADAERVVISNRLGQVECLDRRSGRSLWLYIYPTHRRDLSGPYLWKPSRRSHDFLADSLRRHREAIAGIGVSASVVDGDPEPPAFRIVLDPDPDPTDYYADNERTGAVFSRALFFAVAAAVLWGCLNLYFFLTGKKPTGFPGWLNTHRPGPPASAVIGMVLFAACIFFFLRFGRYSLFSYLSLPALAVLGLGMGTYKLWRTCSGAFPLWQRLASLLLSVLLFLTGCFMVFSLVK